jgi:hypothetical protein
LARNPPKSLSNGLHGSSGFATGDSQLKYMAEIEKPGYRQTNFVSLSPTKKDVAAALEVLDSLDSDQDIHRSPRYSSLVQIKS